jgi:hypothetical protein
MMKQRCTAERKTEIRSKDAKHHLYIQNYAARRDIHCMYKLPSICIRQFTHCPCYARIREEFYVHTYMFGNPLGLSLSVANALHEIIKHPVRDASLTGCNMALRYVFLL